MSIAHSFINTEQISMHIVHLKIKKTEKKDFPPLPPLLACQLPFWRCGPEIGRVGLVDDGPHPPPIKKNNDSLKSGLS